MSEDIFSQFFNLFNNDDSSVNWELAKQINNHITKDEESTPFELSNNEITVSYTHLTLPTKRIV